MAVRNYPIICPNGKPFLPRHYLYVLVFTDGKRYVGSTNNPFDRIRAHISQAQQANWPVSFAIREFGPPTLCILCIGETSYVANLEKQLIIAWRTSNPQLGYNRVGGNKKGYVPSPGSRAKMSAARKGGPLTPQHKASLAAMLKIRNQSPEHKAKVALAKQARLALYKPLKEKQLPRSKQKPGRPKGIPLAPEHKTRVAAALLKRNQSPENRARVSAALKGKPLPPIMKKFVAARQRNKNGQFI